jgi:hypothetical protein
LSGQKPSRSFVPRWSTLRGFAALVLFIAAAIIAEYLIVVYAVDIGVQDEACFQIPFLGLTVSPLFHIVPISTIITLTACWTCMAKYAAIKPLEKAKPAEKKQKTPTGGLKAKINSFKAELLRAKVFAYIWEKLDASRAIVKSAVVILLCFLALALLVSVTASPWLVYKGFVNVYKGNPQLLGSVMAFNNALHIFVEAISPVGWLCSAVDKALRSTAPGIRSFASSFEALIEPLVDLPPVGKYLVLQNFAAWISALGVLAYGTYVRKSYRYRKAKRF